MSAVHLAKNAIRQLRSPEHPDTNGHVETELPRPCQQRIRRPHAQTDVPAFQEPAIGIAVFHALADCRAIDLYAADGLRHVVIATAQHDLFPLTSIR